MPWHPTLINSQILSVHAALVPVGSKGTVLMFGGDEHNEAKAGRRHPRHAGQRRSDRSV